MTFFSFRNSVSAFLLYSCYATITMVNSRTFLSPPKETLYPLAITPHFPPARPPWLLATAHLFSPYIDFIILAIACKWSGTICELPGLASCPQRKVFKVRPRGSVYPDSFLITTERCSVVCIYTFCLSICELMVI